MKNPPESRIHSRIKEGLDIRKSFHIIHYTSRSDKENKVIISINVREAFGKIQYKYKMETLSINRNFNLIYMQVCLHVCISKSICTHVC